MTARSWYDGAATDFFNPFAWTPLGSPQPGDTLTIGDGNPAASNTTLDGYSILLGGPNGAPGPALTGVYTDLTQDGQIGSQISLVPAPNPTLTLANATIGPDTTMRLPSALILLGGPPAGDATIFAPGYAENDGTIETGGGGLLSFGGTLNISIDAAYGSFENRGTITIGPRSGAVLTGYNTNPPPEAPPGVSVTADLSNDGVSNVYGSVRDTARLEGTGTINLDASPGLLGLATTPGRFEFVGFAEDSSGSGQTVAFHGGQLVLAADPSDFHGTLSNFGVDPTDLIELTDLRVVSSSFANGVLTVQSAPPPGSVAGNTASLRFSNLPFGFFNFTPHGNGTDITFTQVPFIPIHF